LRIVVVILVVEGLPKLDSRTRTTTTGTMRTTTMRGGVRQ
jgi:hypothetical protein